MVEWASLAACKVLFSSVFPRPCAVFPQDAEMGNNGPWLTIFLLRIYRGGRFWNEMGCGNTNSDLAAKGSSIQSEAFEVGVVHEGSIRDGYNIRGYGSCPRYRIYTAGLYVPNPDEYHKPMVTVHVQGEHGEMWSTCTCVASSIRMVPAGGLGKLQRPELQSR